MRFTAGIVTAVALASFIPPAAAKRVDQLFWSCSPLSPQSSPAAMIEFSECIGYISGFIDAYQVAVLASKGQHVICLPERGISNDQAVRLF